MQLANQQQQIEMAFLRQQAYQSYLEQQQEQAKQKAEARERRIAAMKERKANELARRTGAKSKGPIANDLVAKDATSPGVAQRNKPASSDVAGISRKNIAIAAASR